MRTTAMMSEYVRASRRRAVGCALVFLLSFTAQARAQLLTTIGDPVRGEHLFAKSCARCHGDNARGTANGPALQRSAFQRQPLELAGIIWNHSPKMTARARALGIARPSLTGTETGDVLAYLYSLGFVDQPGNATRGLVLLKEKQCLSCHTGSGRGATDAPPLKQLAGYSNSMAMLDAMWHHAANMQDEMRAQQLKRVTFTGDDMSHIITYLRTLSGAPRDTRPLAGDARTGATLFNVKGCTRCHAVYGYGGHVGPDLGTRSLPRTPGAIAGLIWNHGSRMRELMARYSVPVPTFTRDELSNLVAYLYFLGFNDAKGDPVKGRALFQARGCARCHGTGSDARTRVGPDLSRSQAVLSSLEAARLMWDHAPKMEARVKEYGLQWPQFQRNELADLLAYVTSLPGGASR